MRRGSRVKKIGSIIFVTAFAALAAAEVDLSATTDVSEVVLDGTVTLQITATYSSNSAPKEPQLPAFADFDVVSRGQSDQTSFQFLNGAPSFRRTRMTTLQLTPRRAGDATIEAIKLDFNGRSYSTQPIKIKVLPLGATPSQPTARQMQQQQQQQRQTSPFDAFDPGVGAGDPFADVHPGQHDLLLRASIDNDRPYVGQQVTYSLYLLARSNVSSIDKLQLPRLDGFWTEDVESPQQLVPEPKIIDGVPYHAFLLRKRALFPLRSGKVQIEPSEVEVLTGFGMLFSRGTSRRASQPVTLDVQPLPPGKPAAFDVGNVGQWQLSATADPATVNVGAPITLRLVATGRGNVRDLRMPRLATISGLRAYDATTTDKERIEQGAVTGTRTVEQLLVPERTGTVEIPALAMDIFDPIQKQYRTLHTEPVSIRVAPALSGGSASEPIAQNVLSAGGVRPIRLRLGTASLSAPPWSRTWFFPLLALPPFGLALLLGFSGARKMLRIDPTVKRVKLARSAATRRLQGAQALLAKGDAAAFYAEVARALTGYLADKQNVAAAGLTRDELQQALVQRGHSDEVTRRLVRVLDDCDRARFAPTAGEAPAREAMLGRAQQILSDLDRA
jgi:hypothetical protein